MSAITLFLDFDGVLHPEYCHESRHFEKRHLLEAFIRLHPHIEIVISSTWRLKKNVEEMKSYFSADVAERIISKTPIFNELTQVPDRFLGYPRHAECWQWQRENRSASPKWFALDDRDWIFQPFASELIQTESKIGLNDEVIIKMQAKIQQLQLI